jgi:S-adenosylmethionine:tRNA ribosyltransferase-isomerase
MPERIARFPLPRRDASKLLVYRDGQVTHSQFLNLTDFLPEKTFLVFNDTKVIPARLPFLRATGAAIELFLLNPVPADAPISTALTAESPVIWQCMVGNRKRWKPDETLTMTLPDGSENDIALSASWHDYEQAQIRFSWQPTGRSFAEIIRLAGQIPLPPYLNREATETDRETYQTVYSRQDGAVAAPTAGLHFTDVVFEKLYQHGINHDFLTLHVGAGTFQPIKTDDVRQHTMHSEQVVYSRQNVENLLANLGRIIPVGTTSMRAIESLYWFAVRLLRQETNPFLLDQHYAYQLTSNKQPKPETALQAVLTYFDQTKTDSITAQTGIYITPGDDSPGNSLQDGYTLKLCNGLITNFHQPGSTLILLIAALIGNDWRRVYNEALSNNYRFLSYGDSSLLLP